MSVHNATPPEVVAKIRADRQQRHPAIEIADRYDVSVSTVWRLTRDLAINRSLRIPPQRLKKMYALHIQGMRQRDIAKATGLRPCLVSRYLGGHHPPPMTSVEIEAAVALWRKGWSRKAIAAELGHTRSRIERATTGIARLPLADRPAPPAPPRPVMALPPEAIPSRKRA